MKAEALPYEASQSNRSGCARRTHIVKVTIVFLAVPGAGWRIVTAAEQRNFNAAVQAGRYFTPNAPIEEEALFAGRRDQLLGVIETVIQKGQHAILYGERGVGKTSLSSVISEFLDVGPILSVRVNCDGTDTFGSAWMKLFGKIETVADRAVPGFAAPLLDSRSAWGASSRGTRLPTAF